MDSALSDLRSELCRLGVDAFIIPRGDMYQGEEVPPSEERLCFISGFTGSAGCAVVTGTQAALFSDGRYTLQMAAQTSTAWRCYTTPETELIPWLKDNLHSEAKIGLDPWLTPLKTYQDYQKELGEKFTLVELAENPIDVIWQTRPNPPNGQAWDYPQERAGASRLEKITALKARLADSDCDSMLITGADELNWLVNIRGHDLNHTPLFLSLGLLNSKGEVVIFSDEERLKGVDKTALKIIPESEMLDYLAEIDYGKIAIDPKTCPYVLARILEAESHEMPSLISDMKARKNEAERAGFRTAHIKDAAAMIRFLAWFDKQDKTEIRETDIADKLLKYRQEMEGFISPSFATICGSGANGAIVHYRAEQGKDSKILTDTLCLIDSGGQYLEATTDLTRTLAVGNVSQAMCDHFTMVLKGHIALAQAVFPQGTTGAQLDAIARKPLLEAKMDFAHGTGHGVGCCLNVHEGPASISKRGTTAIEEGMILSNEPGYYVEGQYGIRIENLLMTCVDENLEEHLCFESLTLVPIDRRLISVERLDDSELKWVDDYHIRVKEIIRPQIAALDDEATLAWFDEATAPL